MKGLERLKTAIQTAVKNSKKGRPAERGIVQGSNVLVGQKLYKKDDKSYNYLWDQYFGRSVSNMQRKPLICEISG